MDPPHKVSELEPEPLDSQHSSPTHHIAQASFLFQHPVKAPTVIPSVAMLPSSAQAATRLKVKLTLSTPHLEA